MKNKSLKYLLFAVLFTALGLTATYYVLSTQKEAESVTKEPETVVEEAKVEEVPEAEEEVIIKPSALLSVPYTVQAPEQSWNIHEESCEEAVVLMSHYFLVGSKLSVIPADTASSAMLKMKAWQVKNYGSEPDLTIERIGKFGKSYYGHNYRYTENVRVEDIKREVSLGNPVIVPVMTHSLGNPNYGRENTYHALLIKGYDKDGVITNDPGVSKGKDYRYTWKTLFSAIDAQEKYLKQARVMLVFD
ncbi:MAG: C39 family peptidase [Patescibacteria group bacterium]|nr:C39 family peptidase [Patescibacteria group bacterium]